MAGAPSELLALNEPYPGVISARREGEPSFSHVQDIGDAYMAAVERGVGLVASAALVEQLREAGELPAETPPWIEVRG